MVAKSKPTISAGAKAATANVGGVNMMKLAEKCSKIEDEDEMEACMMKGVASFQAGLPEKCKTDPSLCKAITTIQDPKTMSGVTAAGEKYQADMKKFRFYKVENCVVDASVNYYRRERHTSEVGGFTFNDISSKTDGVARAVSSGTPCTLEMVVGPDNAISMNFSLASNLSVPGKTVETTGTSEGEQQRCAGFRHGHQIPLYRPQAEIGIADFLQRTAGEQFRAQHKRTGQLDQQGKLQLEAELVHQPQLTDSKGRRKAALFHSKPPPLARPFLISERAALCLQPPLLRGERRRVGAARLRTLGRLTDQLDEAGQRVLAVALLHAEALGGDDEHAVIGQPLAGQPLQPLLHVLGKDGECAHVEAQLHGGLHLVDVLPAGTRGADEAFLKFVFVDRRWNWSP